MKYDPAAYAIQQDPAELAWFVKFLADRDVRSFLEVGSRFGQTLWAVGIAMPPGSLLVSIDAPADPQGKDALALCAETLRTEFKHRVHLIEGDSRDHKVVGAVRGILGANNLGHFDASFIDADHKIESVVLDWINYGPVSRIIGFHDVGFIYDKTRLAEVKPHKPIEKKRIDVPDLWRVFRDRYPDAVHECITRPGKWGIGVLVRPWQRP